MSFTNEQEDLLVQLYVKEQKSTIEISKIVDFACRSSISCWLRNKGLTRTLSQAKNSKSKIHEGTRKGMLTLVKRVVIASDKVYWLCRCDCGNFKTIPYSSLRGKVSTRSCGCWQARKGKNNRYWKGYNDLSLCLFNRYKANAKVKNIEFSVTIEEAWRLFVAQDKTCALTGLPLYFASTSKGADGCASLDRINPTGAYSIDNVQWVHKWVNILKAGLSDDDLFVLVKAIYEYKQLNQKTLTKEQLTSALNRVPFPSRRLH